MTNANNNLIIFKVMFNGFQIGNLNLVKEKNNIDRIKLADIIILDKYRNLGIGKKLLENAINFLPSIGINKIYGIMVGDTDKLERFYQSFGFKISGKNIELDIIKE